MDDGQRTGHGSIVPEDRSTATFLLSRFVEEVRTIVPHQGGHAGQFEWLPNGRTALVFRALKERGRGDVAIVGPHTRALSKNPIDIARAVVLQFKPGWSKSLLGVAANALTNRTVLLADLWGSAGSDLGVELLEARNTPEIVERISRALKLRTRRGSESSSARLARQATHLLDRDCLSIESTAKQLGVTSRHLRRAFIESIGISPKRFARGARLGRALRLTATEQNWSSIAANAGYYDQAHLIADFHELTGLTPSAFMSRRAAARPVEVAGTRSLRVATAMREGPSVLGISHPSR